MKKFVDWISNKVAPKLNQIARNPWLSAVQQAIMTCMPIIFIGSIVTLVDILRGFWDFVPDLSQISNFSMGLMSLFLAFLIPYNLMELKKHNKAKKEAGIAGIALFLMFCGPTFDGDFISLTFGALGAGGMFGAIVAGLFAAFVMNIFANFSFFKEDSQIPDFITIWFDTLIPMFVILLVGYILVFALQIDMMSIIDWVFSPVLQVGDSLLGFIVLYWVGYSFLYSFGISTWVTWPIESAIVYSALAKNQAALAAGATPTLLNAYGVNSYMAIGGSGCTLALALMMFLFARSRKNKIMGKAAIVPSMLNINEPIIFGAPIAFNPMLMIPMWISGLVVVFTTYFSLYLGLVPAITKLWSFWYVPKPIGAFVIGGLPGLILCLVNFALSFMIFYPFFKVYDRQCLEEETQEA
ncbi:MULTISPECIES: PTS transporter subunit EIIC [unclassified Breznakia]|uniref:PTS sugar transporter subunit IIC n=1 Tax=unclassified Breznakia TaxID=2623764 RepID=UPI002473C04F|nr:MULTISPECIES: PTS transporter subunit EIIC [unclassified Breznakia]MDH6366558.1 PTS system cellobiose-specific IIC component [Breznakia sp. PH1-1]MDH6403651.1 PTS system cellobiose-specific IIC component [Breznakia sp. PF1-11]MDH6411360.1 PTS system cellobiose-specific IIC component [Breznakia sp. PFB1-11]MDH6413664.1 PTS system cellobiose-specific IIC component [Breznakia sp. PFB1-14]MDH6415905.1 PTS system cellobiose-specific IIC component [Breznakia sp. PFB1-4]